MQQLDTWTRLVKRVQPYDKHKVTSRDKTRTLSTIVYLLTAAVTLRKHSTWEYLNCQLTTQQFLVLATAIHTDTTVLVPTTGTATNLDVTQTSTCLMISCSNTSAQNTTVLTQRTVFTSVDWVTCT